MDTTRLDGTRTDTTATQDGTPSRYGSPAGQDGPGGEGQQVRFDTKLAVLLRDDLATWQRLNATAFLVSGIGRAVPEVIGEPYADADGTGYLPMFRQPVLVFAATAEVLRAAHSRALARGLLVAVFTAELFATGHDAANRAAVRAVPRDRLDLVGLAVYGPRNAVDRTVKGATLHG